MNVVWIPGQTCRVCATPEANQSGLCTPCSSHISSWGPLLADRVGFIFYGIGGTQSGRLLRGYKEPQAGPSHADIIRTFLYLGVREHKTCLGNLGLSIPTHWATVPSLKSFDRPHPLNQIMGSIFPRTAEVQLTANRNVTDPRAADPAHFRAAPLNSLAHVLLVDDTWARGGHAQSAAMSLKKAGVNHVSILCLARWINREWSNNAAFLELRAAVPYNSAICPWTGGACP
jgi:hypothetical protein